MVFTPNLESSERAGARAHSSQAISLDPQHRVMTKIAARHQEVEGQHHPGTSVAKGELSTRSVSHPIAERLVQIDKHFVGEVVNRGPQSSLLALNDDGSGKGANHRTPKRLLRFFNDERRWRSELKTSYLPDVLAAIRSQCKRPNVRLFGSQGERPRRAGWRSRDAQGVQHRKAQVFQPERHGACMDRLASRGVDERHRAVLLCGERRAAFSSHLKLALQVPCHGVERPAFFQKDDHFFPRRKLRHPSDSLPNLPYFAPWLDDENGPFR